MPQVISKTEGAAPFVLHSGTMIYYTSGNADMERNAQFLAEYLEKQLGYRLDIKAGTSEKGIVLKLTEGDIDSEAYKVSIDEKKILVEASSPAGIFYGIQTIRKSAPVENGAVVAFDACTIEDAPRFSYRGAHFDVCRHFYPVDSVKAFIDMMALHNMNHFHWHITEDQGWRIEIKKYPKLTEVGAVRCGTMIGRDFDSCDSIPYGGFYTQEEAKDIVKYAADRYITVIPEIDMPGHMVAAITAYPELGCTGGPYEVMTKWGISDDLLCMGNEKTFQFIDDVLDEIMEIFPSKVIHIGGDECPKVRWENCPKCQGLIKELGLKKDDKYTAEQKLQSYFTKHVDKYLSDHGRTCIGWDEILEGGISDNATVMSWRGEEGGIEAAQLGHRVIMVPTRYLYFDYYQTRDRENEPLAIGGYVPIKRVYMYDPLPSALSEEQAKYIWGVQANLWTEYIPTFSGALYMYLPRAAAVSEIQWTTQKDYDKFKAERLPRLMKQYDLNGYNYSKRIFIDPEDENYNQQVW